MPGRLAKSAQIVSVCICIGTFAVGQPLWVTVALKPMARIVTHQQDTQMCFKHVRESSPMRFKHKVLKVDHMDCHAWHVTTANGNILPCSTLGARTQNTQGPSVKGTVLSRIGGSPSIVLRCWASELYELLYQELLQSMRRLGCASSGDVITAPVMRSLKR